MLLQVIYKVLLNTRSQLFSLISRYRYGGHNLLSTVVFMLRRQPLQRFPPQQFLSYALVWFAISKLLLLVGLLWPFLLAYIVGCCARQWQAVPVRA